MGNKCDSCKMSDYETHTRVWDGEEHFCFYCVEPIEIGEGYHRSFDFWCHKDCAVKYE